MSESSTKIRIDFGTIPEEIDHYPWRLMLKQGYHWMDKYGQAHWIPDMSDSYLENALKFARQACRIVANEWWRLAMIMNGDEAIDQAERFAMHYDEYDVPLVKGLENELARRRENHLPYEEWELSDWDSISTYLEGTGYIHMDAIIDLGPLVPVNAQGEPIACSCVSDCPH